jgi:preprotein translocase subunit SecG
MAAPWKVYLVIAVVALLILIVVILLLPTGPDAGNATI